MNGQLTLMIGWPGSGKSTYLAAREEGKVVLCPDEFRKVITGHDFYRPCEDLVWGCVKNSARVLLQRGYHVVIDATHLSVSSRSQWVAIAKDVGVLLSAVWLDVDEKICRERNAARDRVVPDDVIDQMVEAFEVPKIEDGFECIVRIRSDKSMVFLKAKLGLNSMDLLSLKEEWKLSPDTNYEVIEVD